MQRKRIIAKVIALFGIALFILNACSSVPAESSDVVIKKFKEAVKQISAADFPFLEIWPAKIRQITSTLI